MTLFLVALLLTLLVHRMRRPLGLAILIVGACMLSGCAGGIPELSGKPDLAGPALNQVTVHQESFTEDQLTCTAEPAPPAKPRTPASVGRYIVDLRAAGADCRGALGAVHDRVLPSAAPPADAPAPTPDPTPTDPEPTS